MSNLVDECPYRKNCSVKFKSAVYCCTKKYLKCIEYQVLRIIKLNKIVKEYAEKEGLV